MSIKLVTVSKLLKLKIFKKLVLSHGVFDVFHYGHKNILKAQRNWRYSSCIVNFRQIR